MHFWNQIMDHVDRNIIINLYLCKIEYSKKSNTDIYPKRVNLYSVSYRTNVRYLKKNVLELPHTRFGMTGIRVNYYITSIAKENIKQLKYDRTDKQPV